MLTNMENINDIVNKKQVQVMDLPGSPDKGVDDDLNQ